MNTPVCDLEEPPSGATSLAGARSTFYAGDDDGLEGIPIISDDQELLRRGVCRAKIPEEVDADRWADELSQVTPMILGFEGDGEYAFYRNILEEPEFPFESIFFARGGNNAKSEDESGVSEIGRAVLKYFPILPSSPEPSALGSPDPCSVLSKYIRLDDAFCVHYNMDQDDTSGAKHMDPSDITINICLHKAKDAKGSYVLFHGIKNLDNIDGENTNDRIGKYESKFSSAETATVNGVAGETATTNGTDSSNTDRASIDTRDDRFLVPQRPGYATIHFGDHPHETTPLQWGSRTNIILTYLYTDPTRSDAATRSCY